MIDELVGKKGERKGEKISKSFEVIRGNFSLWEFHFGTCCD
jgi:hypothetical protein